MRSNSFLCKLKKCFSNESYTYILYVLHRIRLHGVNSQFKVEIKGHKNLELSTIKLSKIVYVKCKTHMYLLCKTNT